MNKKILFGSIISVAVLVGVSFTSVVGYNTVKSTSGEASPLFNIRTNKAIDEKSNDLTCNYVGKSKVANIKFSRKEVTTIQHTINIIKLMDDETFAKFMKLTIHELLKNNVIDYKDIPSAIKSLQELREVDDYFIPESNELLQTTGSECWTNRCITAQCQTALFGCVRYKLFMITVTITFKLFPKLMNVITEDLNPKGPFISIMTCSDC